MVDYDEALKEFNADNARRFSLPGTPRHGDEEPHSFEASDEENQLGELVSSDARKRRSLKKKLRKLRRLFMRKEKRETRRTLDEDQTDLLPFDPSEGKESSKRDDGLEDDQSLVLFCVV